MSIYDAFETDSQKESVGVWVEYPPNADGSIPRFKIAAMSSENVKYSKVLEKLSKPYSGNFEAMGERVAERILMQAFVQGILREWENVQTKEGTTIVFSEPNAIDFFSGIKRLYQDLNNKAKSIQLFKSAQQEEAAKN